MEDPERDFLDRLRDIKHKQIKRYEHFQRVLCKSLVKYPVRHCLFHWFLLFLFAAIVFGNGYFELSDITLNDFAVLEDERVQDFFLRVQLEDNFPLQEATALDNVETVPRITPIVTSGGIFLYQARGEIFTPQNVLEICQIEKLFAKSEEMNTFCPTQLARGDRTKCSAPLLSLSFVFYGNELDCVLLDDDVIQAKIDILLDQQKVFLFDDIDNPKLARSLFFVGGPLASDSPPFKDFEQPDNSFVGEQVNGGYKLLARDFLTNFFAFFNVKERTFRRAFGRENFQTGNVNSTLLVRAGSPLIENIELKEVLSIDQMLSAGSYMVVLILISIYIRSFILAFVSMIGVLFSLLVALTLYAGVFQIDYFTPLNNLVIFLIAGVGADNVLVMVDAWRQSELDVKDDIGLSFRVGERITANTHTRFLENRLIYTFERSILAVSNTAVTTFIAFLATAISPIPAISGLGVFAALTILVNWWFMFTLHPANLMWHFHIFVKSVPEESLQNFRTTANQNSSKASKYKDSIFKSIVNFERGVHDAALDSSARIDVALRLQNNSKKRSVFSDPSNRTHEHDELKASGKVIPFENSVKTRGTLSYKRSSRNGAQMSMKAPGLEEIRNMGMPAQEKRKSCLDYIFEKHSYFVNDTPGRYFLVAGMLVLFGYLTSKALDLETPSNIESNFPSDHMFGNFLIDFGLKFPDVDATNFVQVDMVIGISDFDVSGIKKLSSNKKGGVHSLDPNFEIFFEESQKYVFDLCGSLENITCNLRGCSEETLFRQDQDQKVCPLADFEREVKARTEFTSITVGLPGGPEDIETFHRLAAEFGASKQFGVVDDEVVFMVITNKLSLRRFQPLQVKEPILALLGEVEEQLRKDAPPGIQSLTFSVEENVFLVNELSLVSGMYEGLVISLVASFFVLLIGTQSIRVAFLAVLSVGGVAVAVLGTIELQGGQLGTAEAIAGVFVIGLSVDYIVHLGHMFKHSVKFLDGEENPNFMSRRYFHRIFRKDEYMTFKKRDKVDFTLRKMGPTVLAGALTTLCSALFLSLCTFAFFGKMSNMLVLTVVYALMASFLLFIPALRIMGPGR